MVLFRRLPGLRWRPHQDEQIVPLAAQAEYPEFADDFAILERELMPRFRALDNQALRRQNQFRLHQVTLIFGGGLATVLGALQAGYPAVAWPGAAEAVVAGFLSTVAFRQRELHARDRYSVNRLKAELLRSEYFLFLGRVGAYADDAARVRHLVRRVAQVLEEQQAQRS